MMAPIAPWPVEGGLRHRVVVLDVGHAGEDALDGEGTQLLPVAGEAVLAAVVTDHVDLLVLRDDPVLGQVLPLQRGH